LVQEFWPCCGEGIPAGIDSPVGRGCKALCFVDREGGNMNTRGIIGKEVLDKSGNKVGNVDDIDIDFPQWTVNHLMVKVGIIKKVPVGTDKIDKIGDKIILKIAKDELEKT
jgi:sporulation protein YlmC with PRC-barrel domain